MTVYVQSLQSTGFVTLARGEQDILQRLQGWVTQVACTRDTQLVY